MPGPQSFDGGADPTCGVIGDNDVSTGQVMLATRLYDAVDSDVSGLDGDARLCAVLYQARQLEELAEPDAFRH